MKRVVKTARYLFNLKAVVGESRLLTCGANVRSRGHGTDRGVCAGCRRAVSARGVGRQAAEQVVVMPRVHIPFRDCSISHHHIHKLTTKSLDRYVKYLGNQKILFGAFLAPACIRVCVTSSLSGRTCAGL